MLSLLGGESNHVEKSAKMPEPSLMPDLLDTGDSHDLLGVEESRSEPRITNVPSTAPLVDDLFGGSVGGGDGTNEQKVDDDPFADVSFHSIHNKDPGSSDFFSGTAVDKSGFTEAHIAAKTEPEPFDFFNSSSNPGRDVNDLMGSLSINESDPFEYQNGSTVDKGPDLVNSTSSMHQENNIHNRILNKEFASQAAGVNATPVFPLGTMGYNFPSGLMFNPAISTQQMNAMGSLLAQPQFLAAMSNFQQLGNLQSNFNPAGSNGENSSALPDIFNPAASIRPPTSLMNDSKREESRAFDFISVSLYFVFFHSSYYIHKSMSII